MGIEHSAKAFEQSLHACWERLRAQACRLTGSWQEAEDLVQEALARAYGAWPSFRGDASFATWVQRIMTNVHRDRIKRNIRMRQVPLEDNLLELQAEKVDGMQTDIDRGLEIQDLRRSIETALQQLPLAYRRMIILKYIKHLSYEELAQSFECSIESVRCRLYRARQEMRRLLAENI